MHWITTLTFPLHTSALNTFALSVTVALPNFFPIYASVSCAVLNINSLHFSSTCFDNLPCVLRLMSSAIDKSGEICSMVATKNRGRSIFYYLSITPSTYTVRRRMNDSPVGPLVHWVNRIVEVGGLLLSETYFAKYHRKFHRLTGYHHYYIWYFLQIR